VGRCRDIALLVYIEQSACNRDFAHPSLELEEHFNRYVFSAYPYGAVWKRMTRHHHVLGIYTGFEICCPRETRGRPLRQHREMVFMFVVAALLLEDDRTSQSLPQPLPPPVSGDGLSCAAAGSHSRAGSPSRPFLQGRLVRRVRYSRRAARRSAPTKVMHRMDRLQVPCTSHKAAGTCEHWLARIAYKSRKKEFTLFCLDLSPIFCRAAS
jgi:hypothetical protein